MTDEITASCEGCGATIYKQHINSGIARYEGGKLLCAHCVEEYEQQHDKASSGVHEVMEAISIEEEAEQSGGGTQISYSGARLGAGAAKDESQFKRKVQPGAGGATRVRLFHAKLTDGALTFMSDSINEWLDEHPEITIKHAASTIGVFEGKVHAEPNLILSLFY